MILSDNLANSFDSILGKEGWSSDQNVLAPLLTPSTSLSPKGEAMCVVMPSSRPEVEDIVKLCCEHGIAITPQGGNTGRSEGALTQTSNSIILSLARMNKILKIDVQGLCVTLEAGVIVDNLNETLADLGLFFPISLGASGSCHVGGNIATNAGGHNALKHGCTRQQVLGLECVMANGKTYSNLSGLHKDNRGYSIDHLLIGSEGTLGVITAACLKLQIIAKNIASFFLSVESPSSALDILSIVQQSLGSSLCAAEIISQNAIAQMTSVYDTRLPIDDSAPFYLLLEASSTTTDYDLSSIMGSSLMQAYEQGLIIDIVEALGEQQRKNLWNIRGKVVQAANPRKERRFFRSDIAVPIDKIPKLFELVEKEVSSINPSLKTYPLGHIADGNIHYNMYTDDFLSEKAAEALATTISDFLRDTAHKLGGTFSAEHGIGSVKMRDLRHTLDDTHWQLLKSIKRTFDPNNIMNPNTLIPKDEI